MSCLKIFKLGSTLLLDHLIHQINRIQMSIHSQRSEIGTDPPHFIYILVL